MPEELESIEVSPKRKSPESERVTVEEKAVVDVAPKTENPKERYFVSQHVQSLDLGGVRFKRGQEIKGVDVPNWCVEHGQVRKTTE